MAGSSFFTTQMQYRALAQGAGLARALGVPCASCDQAAPGVLCLLDQSFWTGRHFAANLNIANNNQANGQAARSGIDASTILGPIAAFDVQADCRSPSLQPCHSRCLANFEVLVAAFRNASLYPVNDGIPPAAGVALGRYPEDVYFGGNPWYLVTLAAAEFLYDACATWSAQGYIDVDSTSLAFFQRIYPAAQPQTYARQGQGQDDADTFQQIVDATTAYADSFVAVVEKYVPAGGGLAEQFDRATGEPLSAADLTWSYAAFVTMAQRRAGQLPRFSWTAPGANASLPATCAGGSTPGRYVPATAAGANCSATVTFVVNAPTYYGESILVAGNTTDLGAWDVASAIPLVADNYTAENPVWYAELALTAGETVTYQYIRSEDCGQPVVWETTQRALTVPACDQGQQQASASGVSSRASDDGSSAQSDLTTNDAWVGPAGSSGHCS